MAAQTKKESIDLSMGGEDKEDYWEGSFGMPGIELYMTLGDLTAVSCGMVPARIY